jgi:hypothetical protein
MIVTHHYLSKIDNNGENNVKIGWPDFLRQSASSSKSSCWTHRKIRMQQAIPMARPMVLIKEITQFAGRFLHDTILQHYNRLVKDNHYSC